MRHTRGGVTREALLNGCLVLVVVFWGSLIVGALIATR